MRLACIAALCITLWSASSRADEGGPFGLGLIVGSPTGLTAELQLSDHTAIDGAVGLDLINDRNLYLHVEFLYFLPELISGNQVSLSAYLGVGGYFISHRDPTLGVRAPFGLSLMFSNAPVEIFLEIPLYLRLVQDVDLDVGAALGFRYYF
jgi:hypothetical protein